MHIFVDTIFFHFSITFRYDLDIFPHGVVTVDQESFGGIGMPHSPVLLAITRTYHD